MKIIKINNENDELHLMIRNGLVYVLQISHFVT